jgi:hypothetical protein
VYLAHIRDIVQLSFTLGVFQACGSLWRQTHGTSIGNQISPILSSITVAWEEHDWITTYNTWWVNHRHFGFFSRYVDNRFVLSQPTITKHRPFKSFSDPLFYGHPVILESVSDNSVLGFHFDPKQRTVLFKVPQEPWAYRSPLSAGSKSIVLSG